MSVWRCTCENCGQERLDGTAWPSDEYLDIAMACVEAVAAKETIIYSADGPSRDRLNAAMMTWDAHQWPEIMNAEMGDEQ